MRAWIVDQPGPIGSRPLRQVERSDPHPSTGQVRIRVLTCGVCRTDLHLAEGDLAPRRSGVVPGHEVVGVVDEVGPGGARFRAGDRVGVAWLGAPTAPVGTAGAARRTSASRRRSPGGTSMAGMPSSVASTSASRTPARHARSRAAAPLLCAGIIGYRALLARGGAAGRASRHLRVRRQRPPHRPGRVATGAARPCADPRRTQPGAGGVARCRLGRARPKVAAGAAGRRDLVRSGRRRWCPAPSAAWTVAAPWRLPGSGCRRSRRWTTSTTCSRNAGS